METYDREAHILLRDEAHQRCIHQDHEFAEYVKRVKKAGFEVFPVQCPEWPPVKRTPLPIIVFSISVDGSGGGGSSMGGPTADMTWEGTQLAVACNRGDARTYADYMTERKLRDITREMVPNDWMGLQHGGMKAPERMSYAWQVEEFDPNRHVVIRYWVSPQWHGHRRLLAPVLSRGRRFSDHRGNDQPRDCRGVPGGFLQPHAPVRSQIAAVPAAKLFSRPRRSAARAGASWSSANPSASRRP